VIAKMAAVSTLAALAALPGVGGSALAAPAGATSPPWACQAPGPSARIHTTGSPHHLSVGGLLHITGIAERRHLLVVSTRIFDPADPGAAPLRHRLGIVRTGDRGRFSLWVRPVHPGTWQLHARLVGSLTTGACGPIVQINPGRGDGLP
jgi:hypothetical protein